MARTFVADTSVLIEFFRGTPEASFIAEAYEEGKVCIPTIVRYELLCGVKATKHREQRLRFLEECHTFDLTPAIADNAAKIYTTLRARGQTFEHEDILIAATAIAHDLPVATLNLRHFRAVDRLQLYMHRS
jgi:tRNA(fMet)-specific endonuclease VapC